MRRFIPLVVLAIAATLVVPRPASAYVEAPMSLGSVLSQSTNVVLMTVTKVDKQQNLIIYQKVSDVKGKHPQDTIKHNIGRGGLRAGEWEEIMKWAEVGKQAVFFHNGGASETFIGVTWYQAYPQGEWWGMSHGEPFMLRSYAGKVDKLPGIVTELLANKEVIVPCMVDGDKEAIHKKIAKIQRVKASLKIQDYNPKRDFVGWGGEDIRRLQGMPGFDRFAALPKLDAEAQSISVVDFDNDGKPDVCLSGAGKVVLMHNGGDSYDEVALPGLTGGARSAVWADHNGDGLPDLLLATAEGPRLFTNLGKGLFRDDTKRLPKELAYNLTAAAWGDFDGDGKPDILLANGFHGLRLYKNIRTEAPKLAQPPKIGDWHVIGTFRTATAAAANLDNYKTEFDIEKEKFTPEKEYKGKRNLPTKWAKKEIKDDEVVAMPEVGGNCATYLYSELTAAAAMDFTPGIGTNGTLTVWLNGVKVYTRDQYQMTSVPVTLKLKQGANTLLVKMCDTVGNHAFRFTASPGTSSEGPAGPWFEDVSAAWGLGENGQANDLKGDTLAVADFNGDGKPDFLYGGGTTGLLFLNAGNRFAFKPDSGISYKPGKIGPALADFDGDGVLDLFIPQTDGKCKLYRGKGDGTFSEMPFPNVPGAVSAAWGDFDNDGRPDLVVCCLKGSNRYFRNTGDGKFEDKSAEIGLTQKVFNSQAAAFADLNGDGQLDLILCNEAQDSAILFGAVKEGPGSGKTPVVVTLNGTAGLNGGKVVVKDMTGKAVATVCHSGGDCRGGNALLPRFALAPGEYKVELTGPDGKATITALTVAGSPMNFKLQ